jgi:hypothetical protein
MKKFLIHFLLISVLSTPIVLFSADKKEESTERLDTKQIAIVVFVKGDVKIGNQRLKLGMKLTNGEIIKTGDKSVCDIQVTSSKSPIVIRIKEKSTFQLKESKEGEITEFNSVVDTGKAIFNVSKLNSKEKMNVITPTSTCGVRGTKFETNVRGTSGKERTLVTEGKVVARTRISQLEDLESSENKPLEDILKTVKSGEKEIVAGSYADFSKKEVDEFVSKSGLKEILENSEDENFAQNLQKTISNPKFKDELNSSLQKNAVQAKKLDEKVLAKKNNLYEELIPIDPHLLDRKGLVDDFLAQRNKEKNFIAKIRKLEEENMNLKEEIERMKKEIPAKN